MSVNLEGQIKGINLTNFLQIVQMEKPTCTLVIRCEKKKGALYIQDGEVIDASSNTKHKQHIDAAFEVLSWEGSSIELKKTMEKTEKHINMPLMNILMEAARFKDEKTASGEIEEEFEEEEIDIEDDDFILEGEEAGDSLDSVSLELDNAYDEKHGITAQEIPDEILLEEINPDNEPESDVDKYDLGADLAPTPLSDFTEDIVLEEESSDGFPETEKLYPSIDDYLEKSKPWKKIIAAILIFIVVASGSITGGLIYLKKKNTGNEFAKLVKSISNMEYEEQKVTLLNKFIEKYPDSEFSLDARARLKSIVNRSEKESYDLLIKNIEKLKIDDKYAQRATKYYDNYLSKFPDGKFTSKVTKKKNQIEDVIRDHKFSELKKIPNKDFAEKMVGFNEFRKKYPGIYSEEIDEIFKDIGDYYLKELNSDLENCNTIEKFDKCMKKAKIFKQLFPLHPDHYLSTKIVKKLEENYWADALLTSAEKNTNNIRDEKEYLLNYISKHNRYSVTSAAQDRIREINTILIYEKKFNSLIKYSNNSSYPISNRINRLKAYIHSSVPSEFKVKAKNKLDELEKIRAASYRANNSQTATKTDTNDDNKKTVKNSYTYKKALEKASAIKAQIATSTRFVSVGNYSFTDTLTGKTWTLVDSDDFTNQECLYYKEAKIMAEKLNLDGYSDWRLPTEQELLTLFRNKPFFPVEKNIWFWSSTVFEKGFNTYSAVVDDKRTQQRDKDVKNIFTDCGIFKAIRP